jgi:dTDP-glucose pyrophosphorylase
MKAVILAGGLGTRMSEDTDSDAKADGPDWR